MISKAVIIQRPVLALWCSHCNELETADTCRVCRCAGDPEHVVFVMPHVVCSGCATDHPELVEDLRR